MSDKGYVLAEDDLMPLAIGAALLGTGGGGSPYLGYLRCRELVRQGAVIRVLPLEALPDDAYVSEVGSIGAPVVSIEKIKEGGECYRAMRAVEQAAGITFSALISAEIGGSNAMEPLIVSALSGLPVVDGDGMGRAFPEVQMTSFMIYGAKPSPAAIADEKGNVVVFRDVVDMYWLERFARHTAVDMGASAGLAIAPMRVDFLRQATVLGTVTQALEIGRTLLEARRQRKNVIDEIVCSTGARLFFTGKIVDLRRDLVGGFSRGEAVLAGTGQWAGSEGRIAIQKENLVLWVDGEPVITVPDLIVNLELDTGEPLTTEVLRFGQRMAVLGLPCHPLMKTPRALEVVGPAAFGYPDLSFSPMS